MDIVTVIFATALVLGIAYFGWWIEDNYFDEGD